MYVLLVFKGLRYGFASKSMVESKNLKLKLGLCGLALTSFLALNARGNTVHADTVSGNNADAITWDSDNDDSQVVSEEPQQDNSSQSVQTQGAVQSSVQKQEAPATQSVQSNNQKRAETSVVRVSNFDTSAVNRNNAQNARAQANRVKVSNVNATDAVRVTNPQNSQIVVHYVKTNGQSAGLHDQTISMSKSGNGSYSAPSGYTLAQGNGSYNVNVTSKETIPDFDTYWDVSDKLHMHKGQSYQTETGATDFNMKWDLNGNYDGAVDGQLVTDNDAKRAVLNLVRNAAKATSQGDLLTGYTNDEGTSVPMNYFNISYDPLIYDSGEHADRFLINYGGDNWDAVPYAWVQDSHYRNLNDEDSTYDWNDADFQLAEKIKNWWFATRKAAGIANPDSNAIFDDYVQNDNGGHGFPTYPMFVGGSNGKQFANGDTIFTDGGSATSAVGNSINVPVTKPQSVDPNSANCKRQAQRVIHIAFPNGVKPESYDSITDSAGNKLTLDSNNDLTQTVTFTRSVTVDGLTGATLNQTPWQQQGSINAVTLPDIPGYTMVTSN